MFRSCAHFKQADPRKGRFFLWCQSDKFMTGHGPGKFKPSMFICMLNRSFSCLQVFYVDNRWRVGPGRESACRIRCPGSGSQHQVGGQRCVLCRPHGHQELGKCQQLWWVAGQKPAQLQHACFPLFPELSQSKGPKWKLAQTWMSRFFRIRPICFEDVETIWSNTIVCALRRSIWSCESSSTKSQSREGASNILHFHDSII